jgi:hypothetical protein
MTLTFIGGIMIVVAVGNSEKNESSEAWLMMQISLWIISLLVIILDISGIFLGIFVHPLFAILIPMGMLLLLCPIRNIEPAKNELIEPQTV